MCLRRVRSHPTHSAQHSQVTPQHRGTTLDSTTITCCCQGSNPRRCAGRTAKGDPMSAEMCLVDPFSPSDNISIVTPWTTPIQPLPPSPTTTNTTTPTYLKSLTSAKITVSNVSTTTFNHPCFINGFFLAVRLWQPDFNPKLATTESAAIWIRLSGLPVEYYDLEVLKEVGSKLGTLLRIDTKTTNGERGGFARIWIQLDLSKPAITSITIGSHSQVILFENVTLRFICAILGHDSLNCPSKATPT
ncbi:hypothetical protein LIER_08395 [Lithospermum erythrorhizon]|uniref:DUF4283 domain-containing protein n=1 Tax=Lithospermum erythrorhizon TaxID=34254 RepID=A0AAV3PBW5_LITER